MLEPVELKDFFIVFFSGAMVIMAGALYSLLFAWSKMQNKPWLMTLAYLAYGILFMAVLTLGSAAHLHGYWWWLVISMLVGYLLAPHGIWKLCVATHIIPEAIEKDAKYHSNQTTDTTRREKSV